MSSSNNDFSILYKALPLAVLALAGAYYVMTAQKDIDSTQKSSSSIDQKTPEETTPRDNNNKKFVPQFLRDPDTGEYFVVEGEGQEPRLISLEEMYKLTGSRPVEQEPKPVEVPEVAEEPAVVVVDEAPVAVEMPVETAPVEAGAEQQPIVEEEAQQQEEEQQEPIEQPPVEPQQEPEAHHPEVLQAAPQERVIGIEDFEDFQDEEVDFELERANQQLPQNPIPIPGQAGPGPNTAANNNNRVVGTKKTKSLEKKEQRRAYFEHQRMEAMINKQEEEEFERKYGALIEAERSIRREAEEEAEREKREAAQKQKEEEERLAAEKERIRRDVNALKPGDSLRLETELEREVAKGLVSNSSFLVDEGRLLVKFSEEDFGQLAEMIKQKGFVSYEELAESLTALKN
ncbi:hypothetical protein D0Z00_002249 [Geotrichum galactomycetum]|uniref:Uncharacterized protein n=1 Tax=Geotrichum galactomycetum TaxID=27317 RepID=A0ACB6V4P1_9ASCO|nr:hypothetical protein D0Z00_002249 [Geotrichum candidum]